MAIVSVSMTDILLDRINGVADEHDYAGRSEVVREAARDLLEEFSRCAWASMYSCTASRMPRERESNSSLSHISSNSSTRSEC